jgi:hypothetical protein
MENREEVLSWFHALLPGERIRLNHPTSVFRRYRREMFQQERMADEEEAGFVEKIVFAPQAAKPPPERVLMPLSANDDIAASIFFDTYGDRADAVLRAILKLRAATRRARKTGW